MSIRRRALVAALLCGTAISAPQPAAAGPALGFVQGLVAGLVGSTVIGGSLATAGFVAGVGASTYVTAFLGSFAGRALLSFATAAVVASLTPSPDIPKPSKQFQTFVQPIQSMERGYGLIRTGGPVGFRSGFVDGKKHWTATVASHPTEGPIAHYLDVTEVELDEDGFVVTSPFTIGGDTSKVRLRTYTGAPDQVVDPVLLSKFDEITTAHDFAGHSYVVIDAQKPSLDTAMAIYRTGQAPVWSGLWRMWNEIYDPRTDTTGWSENWALCFAHELAHVRGFDVDWDRVAIEADVCDEVVTNRDGGTQPRYTFGYKFNDDQDLQNVWAQFMAAANAFIWQRSDGKVDFYAGRWIEPTLTLEPEDFVSFSVVDSNFGLSPPSEYYAEYREPANRYAETPSAAYVADPDAPRNARPLAIYGVGSHNQALRVLKPLVRAERARLKCQGIVKLVGYEMIAGRDHHGDTTGAGGLAHRFVSVRHPLLGPDPLNFEVTKLEMEGDGVTFQVELSLATEEDWSFDAATEEPAPPAYNNDQVAESDPIPEITDLSGAAVSGTGGVAQIKWQWTAPADSLSPVLRLRRSGDDWTEVATSPESDEYTQTGLIDGATYEAQIRARSPSFRTSAWKPDTPVTVVAVADTDPPDAHVSGSLAVTEFGGDITVEYIAPNDGAYYATRIYRADYAAAYAGPYDIGDAVQVRLEFGPPNAADSWVDVSPGTGHYAYWIVPINASGVPGTATGPQTEDVA